MTKILLVDDEQRMLDLLELYLEPQGYQCDKAISGKIALDKIDQNNYDLILLDVMMPEMDGWETCKRIKKQTDVPIIMVTARDMKEDVIKGLNLGADDYITKPYDEHVLLARIEALLRRTGKGSVVELNSLVWNNSTHQLTCKGEIISLTPKEFSLIGLLMKNPNRVFERDELIDLVWGWDSDIEGRTIDSHVRNVRDKIRSAGFPIEDHLKTVWGIGYKWTV
ncbi:response regulator transcription factor [Bacillaceae bacterium S4-13-56]